MPIRWFSESKCGYSTRSDCCADVGSWCPGQWRDLMKLFALHSILTERVCAFAHPDASKSEGFPFLSLDAGLPKDAHQQAPTDVPGVRIRDPKLSSAPFHVLVAAAGERG
jgi:hypothetical protein